MVFEVFVSHLYKFPVELVAHTHFTKYPNDKERSVRGITTIEQITDPRTHIEYKKRIATCKNVIPPLLRRIQVLDEKALYLEEESWYDRRNRVLTIKSRSLTWTKYADAWEESEFRPCPENPSWTRMQQKGSVHVKSFGVLGRAIEMFVEGFVRRGTLKALQIMEDLMVEKTQTGALS
ncbi:PRELI domain-containing protein 2-like [Amphiura filiformis]|uniref:PRELI domain-containing protein 2-like n=1 Tax=Amphiura filiformis TaxID=82378 RepID=UPI003B217F10